MDEFTSKLFAERERQDAIYAQRELLSAARYELEEIAAAGVEVDRELVADLHHMDVELAREVLTGRIA